MDKDATRAEFIVSKTGIHKGVFTIAAFTTITCIFFIGMIWAPLLILRHMANQMLPAQNAQSLPPFLLIFPVVVSLIPTLLVWFACWKAYEHCQIIITSKRLKLKTGLFVRQESEITLQQIETVTLHQGVLGLKFGYGTVVVTGVSGTRFVLAYLPEPDQFRQRLTALIQGDLPQQNSPVVRETRERLPARPEGAPTAEIQERVCSECCGWITMAEAQHCRAHPEQFSGRLVCIECQKFMPKPS